MGSRVQVPVPGDDHLWPLGPEARRDLEAEGVVYLGQVLMCSVLRPSQQAGCHLQTQV